MEGDGGHNMESSIKFYECVFCKRGFSTAQALGGHMNIHRKDRAKMRQNNPTTSRSVLDHQDEYGFYRNHRSFNYPPNSESLFKNYRMLFPVAARDIRREDVKGSMRSPKELRLFGEDHLNLGLRLHGHGSHVERREKMKEGEVDLELRLGTS